MPPGLKIEVDEEDFEKLTIKKQNLILFKIMRYMDEHGTKYERKRMKKLYAIATVSGGFFGAVAGLIKGLAVK